MPIALRNLAAALLLTAAFNPAQGQEVLLSRAGTSPSVAASGRGGFVITWTDLDASQSLGILASLLPKGAQEPRAPFRVNPSTAGFQVNPDVAADDAGRFAVVWQDGLENFGQVPSTGGARVFGESFGAAGRRQSPAVRLSPAEVGQQVRPQVAMLEDGGFVAAWLEDRLPRPAIKAARFSATGSPLGPEMEMRAGGELSNNPQVAAFPGGFAVGWFEFTECSGGRPAGFVGAVARFDTEGRRAGKVYRVGTSRCSSPEASVLRFLVGSRAGALAVFASERVFAQRFSPTGEPMGGHILLPEHPCDENGCTQAEAISMDNSGRFTVVWEVRDGNGNFSLAAQLFNPRGKPLTGLVPVSDSSSTTFQTPATALADDGTLVVVWRREGADDPKDDGLFLRKLRLR